MDSTLAMIAELISSTDNSAFLMSRRVQIVHETRYDKRETNWINNAASGVQLS